VTNARHPCDQIAALADIRAIPSIFEFAVPTDSSAARLICPLDQSVCEHV